MSMISNEQIEEIRKYVYDHFGIPAYVAENPDITTQKKYFTYRFPIDMEPPKIMEPEPWLLKNPALDLCKVVSGREIAWVGFDEKSCEKLGERSGLQPGTDGENSAQV